MRAARTSGGARRDAASGPAPQSSEYDALLDLQESAGNRAVAQLLIGGEGVDAAPRGLAPVGNRALAATLQRRPALQRPLGVDGDPKMRVQILRDAIRPFEPVNFIVIDAAKVTEALSNLTAAGGRAVMAEYKSQTKMDLGWVLSGTQSITGSDGPPAKLSISKDDKTRLQYLLLGTVEKQVVPERAEGPSATPGGPPPMAAPAPDPDAGRAGENRLRVIATGIHTAIGKKDAAAAIALIPPDMQERRDVDTVYDAMYGQTAYMALFTKLPGKQGQRAAALWYDEKDDADRLAIEAATDERDKAAKQAKAIEGVGIVGDVAKDIRRKGERKLEAEVKRVASAGDQSTLAGRAASRERLRKIVASGDPKKELAKKVGLDSDPVLKAIAEGNEADEIGARLARADATNDLQPAEVESAIRELRSLAEGQAAATIELAPDTLETFRPYITKAVIDGYFTRFKEAFNKTQTRRSFEAVIAGRGGSEEKAAKALGLDIGDVRDAMGQTADFNRNKVLLARGGELDEWGELFFALTRKPKDIDRVRGILGSKTYTEVQSLAAEYAKHTNRSLEADLAGPEVEQLAARYFGGEVKEELDEKRGLLGGSVFDRNLAEGRIPRDADPSTREARVLDAEGDFLSKKLVRLERRIIENRGLFARARDWSGNVEKEILDKAREDAYLATTALRKALNPDQPTTWTEGQEGVFVQPNLGAARRQVEELRRIERRMDHAASIYKAATKKAYEEFVDLVVNAATIAAGLGVTGIWLTALRTTAATVGTKLLMKGEDYSVDEFLADVGGGMAGAAGDLAKLGMNTFVTPYVAKKIMQTAGKLGMSKAFQAQVAAKLGPVALRQAEHTLGTATSNVLQDREWTEGQGGVDRLKGELQNVATGPLDAKMKSRKEAAAAAKARKATGGADEEAGAPRTGDEAGGAPRPAAGGDATTGSEVAGAAAQIEGEPGGTAAADTTDEPLPRTSMALPETPAARPARRADDVSKHPVPQAEAPAAGKPKGRPESSAVASSPVDYPAGAVQLNTPPKPTAGGDSRPAPTADDLRASVRSEALRKKADARLAQARRNVELNRDELPYSPIRVKADEALRSAQHLADLAHGQRPPTEHDWAQLKAEEHLANVEAEYADVLGAPGSPRRVAAEDRANAAAAAHARAREAVRKAEVGVELAAREAAPGSPIVMAAQTDLDRATTALRAAELELKQAKGEQTKAAVGMAKGDWRRRRAEIALHGAKRDQAAAYGHELPEDKLGPARKGDAERLQGPPERFPPHLWDQEMVIQVRNVTSKSEAENLVRKMLHQDPSREVGMFRNTETGEYIVVRGKEKKVTVETDADGTESGPRGAGRMQRWKEILGKTSDVGRWELVLHTHPSKLNTPVDPLSRYPSAGDGDFGVIHEDAAQAKAPRQSAIWYFDGTSMQRTEFGIDPDSDNPYWIKLPGQEPERFASMDEYRAHLTKEMAPHNITPKFGQEPPMIIGRGTDPPPVAGSPVASGVETAPGGVGTAMPATGVAKGAATADASVDSRQQAQPGPARKSKAADPNADIPAGGAAPSVPRRDVYTQHDWGDYEVLERPKEGQSDSYRLRHKGTGKIYIFKPTKGEQSVPRAEERGIRKGEQAPRTRATELTAGRLGIETPDVDLVRIGTSPGSLTEWIGLNSLGRLERDNNAEFQRIVKSEEFRKLRATVDALDYLTNNLDRNRNYGNYLYELGGDGKVIRVVPIDHDLTFTSTVERANLEAYTRPLPETYTPDMVDRLVRLSRDRQAFVAEIEPLVGREAIPGVLHRLDQLLADARSKHPAAFDAALARR